MREEKELKNLFNRILFASVLGLVTAHLSHFNNPFFISFFSVMITMALRRYSIGILLEKISAISAGITLGVVVDEIFLPFPHLESFLIYIIFLTTLKLFAHDYKTNTVFLFNFSFMYTSIYGSYLEAAFDSEVLQYFWELIWVFIIVTVTFKLFPSNMIVEGSKPLKKSRVKNWEIYFYSLVLSLVWNFSMLFEFRFAFFAYVVLISIFIGFDTGNMEYKAIENIKTHFKACSIVSIFSLFFYGMVKNIFLLSLGYLLVFIPIIRNAVYPKNPKKVYGNFSLISGLIVPFTLYINLDGAAVYKCLLRSTMITLSMLLILFILKLIPYNRLS